MKINIFLYVFPFNILCIMDNAVLLAVRNNHEILLCFPYKEFEEEERYGIGRRNLIPTTNVVIYVFFDVTRRICERESKMMFNLIRNDFMELFPIYKEEEPSYIPSEDDHNIVHCTLTYSITE